MKIQQKNLLLLLIIGCLLGSCGILGKRKSGCPQGRNVGAERILAGEKKAIKIASKKSKLKI
jgi:hypothetical protein